MTHYQETFLEDHTYFDFVKSRCKSGMDIIESLTPEKAHLLHMAVGISGEVAELATARDNEDDKNIKEELGDLLFYIVGAGNAIVGWKYQLNMSTGEGVHGLVVTAGTFLDTVKKYTIYNKPVTHATLISTLDAVLGAMMECAEAYGYDLGEIAQENMEKLTKRYATGYSDAAAIARADKNTTEGD